MSKVLVDIGSTYFKVATNKKIQHHFRNFDISIYEDLTNRCGDILVNHKQEDIHICSSANGGLSTLIIGITESFSLKYASNIAYNSGINIIETIIYDKIDTYTKPIDEIDVVIIVGGIDSNKNVFDKKLIDYLESITYQNIVYVGSSSATEFLTTYIQNLVVLPNIIDDKLKMYEDDLKEYLTNLYAEDIMGKDDIKELYELTSNQIYSTPYIVNQALPHIHTLLDVADPFIVVDIGGGTTEIGVTSLGGLVLSKSIKVAGDRFDKAIIDYVRQNFNLFIGERTAENIKLEVGTAIKQPQDKTIQVKGRDSSGLLTMIELTGEGVRAALTEPFKEISLAVRQVLEEMPPDLAGDVVDNGVVLTGGGALIRGIDKYLANDIKLPVRVADEPLLAVAYGTSKTLDEESLLKLISNE